MPETSPPVVIGVDVGGTSVKAAVVSGAFEMLASESVPTDRSSERALLDSIAVLVQRVAAGREVSAVGFGLPSQIDQRTGVVRDSINVPLVSVPFAREMESRLGLPVRVDNDANAACLAEVRAGAARGADDVVMLTLGTGVGGGLVLDGDLYRGACGFGAELGHMVVDENGPRCQGHCPNRGCLEIMASAVGVRHAAAAVLATSPGGALEAARADGVSAGPRYVIDHATAGDAGCVEVLARVGRHLGVGIASCINIFNPEVVVIGGGIASAGELLLGPARAEAGRRALPAPYAVARIVGARLGNDAGVLGAAALVLGGWVPA